MLTATKDAEAKLVDMVGDIQEESSEWRAVHFHFSKLLEHYRSDYQIKIAVNLINDLMKAYQGGIFVCADSDIIVLSRGANKAQLEKVIFQLRYLFMDDPLAYGPDGQEMSEFCTLFDLSVQWQMLMDTVKRKMVMAQRGASAGASAEPLAKAPPAPMPIPKEPMKSAPSGSSSSGQQQRPSSFTPAHLANVERELSNADLSKVLRRQPVCASVPSMMIRRVFDELYINIAHLRQLLRMDVDFSSNRWLFKYLTQILDERMLDLLRRNATRYFDTPVSLNLNVPTLLSNKFADFDAALNPAIKVSIVIEIQVADVFADMAAFMVAKESVQKLGYRVCLDGLTNLSFTQIDRERLGFDLAKLQWNADMESDLKSKENKRVADAIKACGPNRVILCRCDSRHAVDYGQALGVSLFQGRFLDKVINPSSKVEN